MHQSHQYPLPCLYCHPHSYVRMVQNLIERCLLFHMSQDQCIKALAEHAGIKPLVTLTVWRELQKENKEFFRDYLQVTTYRPFMNIVKGDLVQQEGNTGNNQVSSHRIIQQGNSELNEACHHLVKDGAIVDWLKYY